MNENRIVLSCAPYLYVPSCVDSAHGWFRVGERRIGFILLAGLHDLPMWAAARIYAGKYTVEGDTVVIDRADQDTETAEYVACFAPKPEDEED